MEEVVSNQKDGEDNDLPTKDKDKLFDPSIDMLVNDFDDERTLEEEEALAAGESQDPDAELSDLQKVRLHKNINAHCYDFVYFRKVTCL